MRISDWSSDVCSSDLLGITIAFEGEGEKEVGVIATVSGDKAIVKPGQVILRVDPRYDRPTEVETLLGDPSKAKAKLGWETRVSLRELGREMVAADYTEEARDTLVKKAGFRASNYHKSPRRPS